MTSPRQLFRINDLPIELQREIFYIAATADLQNATQIVRVARRICAWVQPIIYAMVTLGSQDTELFLRTVHSKPRQFFAAHVKRLCLSVSVSAPNAAHILTVCTGVRDLAFWVDFLGASPTDVGSLHSYISPLPLRRLSMELSHILDLMTRSGDLSQYPWSAGLTHLDVVFWTHEETPSIPGLERFPALTHLALWLQHSRVSATSLATILSACNLLRILVIVVDEAESLAPDQDTFADPRIVLIPYLDVVPDWEAPMRGLPDTWSRAEDLVRAQMQKAEPDFLAGTRPVEPDVDHKTLSGSYTLQRGTAEKYNRGLAFYPRF
ncbi:hypothetical protein BDN72DRAFT_897787 [Pluteus cervinus]|uniref:Uncharacterized protein n=1 Tax=Pluteus cervinus TaxID=181527 RepID=A0ACD3ASW4_9AGAR|nr:hypothetical protein BDN72DRAFT_897787 [Pluteus cervinus]